MNARLDDDYDPYFDDDLLDDEDEQSQDDEPNDDAKPGGPDRRARTFPAFPAGARGGRRFARTWWGNAWIEAMEIAAIDPEQLSVGRRYAHAGHVGAITVSPGRMTVAVHDGDYEQPYHTTGRVAVLTDDEWARFLDRVASRAGHIAALLDGEMPHDLVDSARDAGVVLLPGVGDLDPVCDCPDWNHPCKHAAALFYQTAWLLDTDPFVLLLMRGRSREELLSELRLRDAGPRTDDTVLGTPAAEAYSAEPVPLPPAPAPAARAPMSLAPLLPDSDQPVPDPAGLSWLAADAAARAEALLAGHAVDPVHRLDAWTDAVRLGARIDDPEAQQRLAARSGKAAAFARSVAAWRFGGEAGLRVLEDGWTPPAAVPARAHRSLALAWSDAGLGEMPEIRSSRNRSTVEARGIQLRYGRDGQWYPYRREGSMWMPVGPPHPDADNAAAELLRENT
jgi:uncharacterized Zn finger protein